MTAHRMDSIIIVGKPGGGKGKVQEQEWPEIYRLLHSEEQYRPQYFCQVEETGAGYVGCMRFLRLVNGSRGYRFVFTADALYFYEPEGNALFPCVEGVLEKCAKNDGLERFVSDFFLQHIENELQMLEELENHVVRLEEGILKGILQGAPHTMLQLKRRIRTCYRYYNQLARVGQCLADDKAGVFGKDAPELFANFTQRVQNLASETQQLREYAMQVQEVYHTEIEIRQNNVMKMLTLLTAIFLPLSLVVGWYGMNFEHMPEIGWRYGYLFVALLSAGVVTAALVIFKRKKYW